MNKKNLKKLAAHLESLPADYDKFDMSNFAEYQDGGVVEPETVGCGTVCCAVGEAVRAGVPFPKHPSGRKNWWTFCDKQLIDSESAEWRWCFSADWADVDNTPQGAAARIRWLLDYGLPDNWNKQLAGVVPLCYRAITETSNDIQTR